jgi:hypothetical protein
VILHAAAYTSLIRGPVSLPLLNEGALLLALN